MTQWCKAEKPQKINLARRHACRRCSLLAPKAARATPTCASANLTLSRPPRLSLPGDCRIPFSAVYATLGFKEANAKVYLPTVPITARIQEVERFAAAQERFNLSQHRSVNKVQTQKYMDFVFPKALSHQNIHVGCQPLLLK